MPNKKKTRGAGDERSPAKPIKSNGKKTASIQLDGLRSQMIELAKRLAREVAQERLQKKMPDIPNNIDPKYYTLRRKLLTGDPVSIDELSKAEREMPSSYLEDITFGLKRMVSEDTFILQKIPYKVVLKPYPNQSSYKNIDWEMIVSDTSTQPYNFRRVISGYDFALARSSNDMSIQQYFDMIFCQMVAEMELSKRNTILSSGEGLRLRTEDEFEKEFLNEYLQEEAIAPLFFAGIDKAKEEPKPPKVKPSPFSMIEVEDEA